MTFEPKQKNRAPEVCVTALFVCSLIATGFSSLEFISGRGILQFIALVLVCAALFIFIRYKTTSFRYTVKVFEGGEKKSLHHEDDEEAVAAEGEMSMDEARSLPVTAVPPEMLELRIERRNGRGPYLTECLLRLTDIEKCLALPEEKDPFAKLLSENKRLGKYKYFKNLQVSEQMVLLSDSPSGKVFVFLERDAKLFEYLRAVAAYNYDKKEK